MKPAYINRELSWLEFNQRVLEQAERDDLPLLERLKFLAITAGNLDEFFQVRVGGLMLMRRSGHKNPDPTGMTPNQQIQAIRRRVLKMVEDQSTLFTQSLAPALHNSGIQILQLNDLNADAADRMRSHFITQIAPLLTPVAVDLESAPPHIPALQIILACLLKDDETGQTRHVLVALPEGVARLIPVDPNEEHPSFLLAEDLVASHIGSLFPGEKILATTPFRVTRNGDIAVQEEDAIDLAGEMEDVLAARKISDTVRLELPIPMNRDLGKFIQELCLANSSEVYRSRAPLDLAAMMTLIGLPGFDSLRIPDWTPQHSPDISLNEPVFDSIARRDILLHHPYESYEPVLRLLEEAAEDPGVLSIKQVLYRTAKNSRVINALIRAAENGKNVTVLVELKARFDEARNLDRAEELQRAGAQIVYGVKGLKTHAKILMIVRREAGSLRRYIHLGTGNYNESTARLYTDLSLLTCRPDFGSDASLLFNAVTGRSKLLRFQRLAPAPNAMKPMLLELIADEAERARQGEPARIIAKTNSLQDPEIIDALYAASAAGVEIKLNVRGICCLKTGASKRNRNIEVISIIDRFLEHSRIFYFHQGGDSEIFISSADWMTRNLDRRVELMIPIEDARIRRRLTKILNSYFRDNSQAWRIKPDGSSEKIVPAKGEKRWRAQHEFYQQARKTAKADEHERAMRFEPHLPPEEESATTSTNP